MLSELPPGTMVRAYVPTRANYYHLKVLGQHPSGTMVAPYTTDNVRMAMRSGYMKDDDVTIQEVLDVVQ